jgi:hypothetical protein
VGGGVIALRTNVPLHPQRRREPVVTPPDAADAPLAAAREDSTRPVEDVLA